MLYPSIDKILTKINSKYTLVHIIARRSKEMNHNNMALNKYVSQKNLGKALEEIAAGKITME